MAYSNNETQFSHTWIWTANVHNNMDESPNHYGEWKRSNTKTTYCEILEYDSLKETSLISPGREHTRAYLGLWRKEGIHEEGHSRVARFSKKNTGCPLKFEFQIKSGFFFFFYYVSNIAWNILIFLNFGHPGILLWWWKCSKFWL